VTLTLESAGRYHHPKFTNSKDLPNLAGNTGPCAAPQRLTFSVYPRVTPKASFTSTTIKVARAAIKFRASQRYLVNYVGLKISRRTLSRRTWSADESGLARP